MLHFSGKPDKTLLLSLDFLKTKYADYFMSLPDLKVRLLKKSDNQ